MSEPQQYILKQSIRAEMINPDSIHTTIQVFHNDAVVADISCNAFNEIFEPLDVPAIEKQLEEKVLILIDNLECHPCESEMERHWANGIADILGVFGLENKETDNV